MGIVPLLAASLVGLSRIRDAKHHPFDVVFAAMVGMTVAWGAYRQYYLSLASLNAGFAYPVRSWGSSRTDISNARNQHFKWMGRRTPFVRVIRTKVSMNRQSVLFVQVGERLKMDENQQCLQNTDTVVTTSSTRAIKSRKIRSDCSCIILCIV